jgi:hypothetical protein
MRIVLVTMGLLGGIATGVACAAEDDCTAGYEACPCAAGTCLDGLVCLSGYCVNPDWEPPVADGSGGNDDDSNDFDNVAACEDLIDDFSCGDVDLGMYVDCDVYGPLPCDVADYFDCVDENIECNDGVLDASDIMECVSLAQCD